MVYAPCNPFLPVRLSTTNDWGQSWHQFLESFEPSGGEITLEGYYDLDPDQFRVWGEDDDE